MFDWIKVTPTKRSVKISNNSGIIFSNPNIFKKLLFYLGTGILLISFVFLIYLYKPLFVSWWNYKNITLEKKQKEIFTLNEKEKETNEIKQTPVVFNNDFDIRIPKIGAFSTITKNISPLDRDEYIEVLKNDTIAHSNISSLPNSGIGTMTYLFAHSTQQTLELIRKNSVFYLLGELEENDDIFINYGGKYYNYKVYMKKIVGPKETDFLTYTDKNKEILILQTCWPIGTNLKRLLIFAQRV